MRKVNYTKETKNIVESFAAIFNKYDKRTKSVNEDLYKEMRFLTEDEDTDSDEESSEDKKHEKVTDEQLRIDALKIAVKLSRLMNKVTAEDILEITTKIAAFLKDYQVGTEYEVIANPDQPNDSNENSESDENNENNPDNSDEDKSSEPDEGIAEEEFIVPDIEDSNDDSSESANEEEFIIPDEFQV